jgi:hypothetical protein
MLAVLFSLVLATQVPLAPHADHQPVQEGVFAAAAGDTLHLEATLQPGGVFRVIVNDRTGRPLPADQRQAIALRLVLNDVETVMLLDNEGRFGAQVPANLPFPATIAITLARSGPMPAERVAFTFTSHNTPDGELMLVPPTVVPPTRAGIVDALKNESAEAQAILDGRARHGALIALTRVHDLALALEAYLPELKSEHRTRAATAIKEAVRLSWLLHAAIDVGIPPQARLGLMLMRDAVDELCAVFVELLADVRRQDVATHQAARQLAVQVDGAFFEDTAAGQRAERAGVGGIDAQFSGLEGDAVAGGRAVLEAEANLAVIDPPGQPAAILGLDHDLDPRQVDIIGVDAGDPVAVEAR